jgi:glutamin-(asparagin-)ase
MTRDTAIAARKKAGIMLIGTGGTIAGRGASSVNTSAYDCSVLSIDEILADLPVANSIADIAT